MSFKQPLSLSDERFTAVYQVTGSLKEAAERAFDICVEQTVEFPIDLIHREDIREQVVGEVLGVESVEADRHLATIRFAGDIVGGELTQLLNVLFGNISLKPGIRLVSVTLPDTMLARFRGPRFGLQGLRSLTGIAGRPLVCTALKPMGLSAPALADIAYRFALGGVDFIKDDHGLADQAFAPFSERLKRITAALRKAADRTGRPCLYMPNITAPSDQVMARAETAKDFGAGGLLIAPGITGFDTLRRIAEDDRIGLPVFSHPTMLGTFTAHPESGISHGVLYGLLNRLAGADATIFPHFGGRFTFTKEACGELAKSATGPLGGLAPMWPVPAGGMSLEKVEEMTQFYGTDIILLIGGNLHRKGPDLTRNARELMERL